MVQLVIPMAGLGSRFSSVGYKHPKPLLPLMGRTMIEVVVENLMARQTSSVTLVASPDHRNSLEGIRKNLEGLALGSGEAPLSIQYLTELSQGPADSVRQCLDLLDKSVPMIVANSDQYVVGGIEDLYSHLLKNSESNGLLVLEDSDPKWSFARLDKYDFVLEVKEKKPISNFATAGIYGFSNPRVFNEALGAMDAANDRTNGELYVGPTYNYVAGKTKALHLGTNQDRFFGLGTPDDYELFRSKFETNRL
jgi:NDP-sugar pyrophosphorylase family protein